MQDLIGRTLGHYRIVEKIGAGGMGEVYRATDERLDRDAAIKVLPEEVAQDPERLARFEREAKLLASLSHQNIATLYGLEEHDGERFLVMEVAEGETLAERIERGPIPIDDALDYACQIAEGLEAAHEKGIIHRDLKPANIMLSTEGGIKILDFGLAKAFEPPGSSPSTPESIADSPTLTAAVTGTGVLLGTTAYMSPEQARGKAVDKRADVWAFGCVLYEMLTGRKAFPGDDASQTMAAILRDDPEWTVLSLATPDPVRRLLNRCLTKDPRDRLHDIADARIELQSLSARHPNDNGPNTHDPTSMRRSKWLSPIPVLVAMVLVIGTTAVIWNSRVRGIDDPAAGAPPRIVVLPFENLGPPEDEYFADGMTEEITSRLSSLSGLHVISRTSAMKFKDTDKNIREIGEALGVQFVLEGTVRWERKEGEPDHVRITPQLIQVVDDRHLWSDRFDRSIASVFEVQSDIAIEVTRRLAVDLVNHEEETLRTVLTEDQAAHDAYLRGMYFLKHGFGRSEEAHAAIDLLEQAVEQDPGFALAWAKLAVAHALVFHHGRDRTPDRCAAAENTAKTALRIDPTLADGHGALGFFHYVCQGDYERAVAEYDSALSIRPNDAYVLFLRAAVRKREGRFRKALDGFTRAAEIDPMDVGTAAETSIVYSALRQYPEAVEAARRAVMLSPNSPGATKSVYDALILAGRTGEARRVLEQVPFDYLTFDSLWVEQLIRERRFEEALEAARGIPNSTYEKELGSRAPGAKAYADCRCSFFLGDLDRSEDACAEAIEVFEGMVREDVDTQYYRELLAETYSLLGRSDDAIREIRMKREVGLTGVDVFDTQQTDMVYALILGRAGRFDEALDLIEHLLSTPSGAWISVPELRNHPNWDPLRDHPRFQALLEEYDTE